MDFVSGPRVWWVSGETYCPSELRILLSSRGACLAGPHNLLIAASDSKTETAVNDSGLVDHAVKVLRPIPAGDSGKDSMWLLN